MFFLNVIDCSECREDMKILKFNRTSKKIIYGCSCGAHLECDFALVGMSRADELFGLNETGLLTYKCERCGYFVREYLSSSKTRNDNVLLKAYNKICKKCEKKEEESV